MNRLFVILGLGFLASTSIACSSSTVGDPCTPEDEFRRANAQSFFHNDLGIDVNSVQCETRVCLRHYFEGRVTCPYGNGNLPNQGNTGQICQPVPGKRGLFTFEGTFPGTLCCPVLGDMEQKPLNLAVPAQCSKRGAKDSVYCSCRCNVPDDPEIDRGSVNLCKCPSGYSCTNLCDRDHGSCSVVPKGKWGSYCVKDGERDFDPTKDFEVRCGAPLVPM